EYRIPDTDFPQGINYYRVKMVNVDGSATFTKIVQANNGSILQQLTIVPNPNNGTFRILNSLCGSETEFATLEVFNGSGQKVHHSQKESSRFNTEEQEMNFL